MRAKPLIVLVVSAAILLSLLGGVVYARPAGVPANRIERGVFIDPAPETAGAEHPSRRPGGGTASELDPTYIYGGIHWADPFVHYKVRTAGSKLDPVAATGAVDSSFWSWQTQYNVLGRADQSDIWFVNDGAASSAGPALDGANVVSWANMQGTILAATYYWYDSATLHLIETDIVFNGALRWSATGETRKYDVWNIGAHEAGHVLQLDDLYDARTAALTMYGYGTKGETKKQTLGLGDMLGVESIYPTTLP